MDSALKRTALIAESVVGTTPATPAFLIVRDTRVSGAPNRPSQRSPERRSDRRAAHMTTGLYSYPKVIELPWQRDAATDVLWSSLFGAAFSTNVLKDDSLQKTFTLEERYEGGATDPYRRLTGCQVDSCAIGFQLGQPGTLAFTLKALAEGTATTAIASSTYVVPTPDLDPSTPIDIVTTTLFGLTTPKVVAFNMQIQNTLRERYAFGSADPGSLGFGAFDVSGSAQVYFNQLADYSAFVPRAINQALDMTIGFTTAQKDQIQMGNVDVYNPDVSDPGQTGDHIVTLNFMGRYYVTDNCVLKLTRNVT